MRALALAALLCGVNAVTAAAQDKPSANPGRPTLTNPATLPPVGYLQFEQGYNGALRSPNTDTQYGMVQTTRLAVQSRLMVQVASQPIARSRADGQVTHDAGDVLLGGTAVLFTPKESEEDKVAEQKDRHLHSYVRASVPTVSVSYMHRVYEGTAPDIDLGAETQGATLLASGHVPWFDAHYDINIFANEQTDDRGARRLQTGQGVALDRPVLSPNLQLSGEIYHFTQPTVYATASGHAVTHANLVTVLLAASYQFRPNFVMDAGFSRGLTSTTTRWQSFAGFTYVLPRRLWPEHKRS